MRVVNFAHGDFMMLGMYAAFYLVTGFGTLAFLGPYVGPVVGALLAGPIVFAVGWVLHKTLIAKVTGARVMAAEAEGHYAQIILTLGIALVLANGGLILFGSTPLSVQTPLSRESWEIGLIFFNQARTVGFIIAVAVRDRPLPVPDAHQPRQGAARRRRQSDRGGLRRRRRRPRAPHRVRARRRHHGVAGGLFAMSQSFQPYIGFDFVIVMYAGVVLGGMGSILGAFWGGLTIGLVQQMSTLVLPYQLQNTAIFVVFLVIVFFRPQGMFGRVWERA